MNTTLEQAPSVPKRPVEILLVEDNPGDITLIQELLKDSHFAVHLSVLRDGENVLAFLQHQTPYLTSPRPDFILLDLSLPYRSGFEVASDIKHSYHLKQIPTLILTGSNNDIDRWSAAQVRADAYLLKPRELTEFSALLNYLEENWMKDVPLDNPPN